MAGAYLYVWDADNEVWVKLSCTEDGEPVIDTE